MAGKDLRGAVQHEVGTVLERPQQQRAQHRVVDDHAPAGGMDPFDHGSRSGKVSIGFEHGSSQTRSASGGSPVWSNATTSSPQRDELAAQQTDRSVVAAVGDRDLRARPEQREHQRRGRAHPGREEQGFPALELAEQSLRVGADGMRVALVVEGTRGRVLVGVDGRAVDRRGRPTNQLRFPASRAAD